MNADHRDFLASLAYLFLYHRLLPKAEILYSALRILDPENRSLDLALGYCWLQQNQPTKTLTLLDELGDTTDSVTIQLRVECLLALGRWSEARTLLTTTT